MAVEPVENAGSGVDQIIAVLAARVVGAVEPAGVGDHEAGDGGGGGGVAEGVHVVGGGIRLATEQAQPGGLQAWCGHNQCLGLFGDGGGDAGGAYTDRGADGAVGGDEEGGGAGGVETEHTDAVREDTAV